MKESDKEIERIELFGYPGSGKTTTMEWLSEKHPDFRTRTANVKPSFKSIFSLIGFIILNPGLLKLFRFLFYIPNNKIKPYFTTVIRFFLRIQFLKKNIKTQEKVIVDEGILQITWSLLLLPFIYSTKLNIEKELESIVHDWWPDIPMKVYVIYLSREEYIRRVYTRERKHYFSLAYIKNNTAFIEKADILFKLILEKTKKNKYLIHIV